MRGSSRLVPAERVDAVLDGAAIRDAARRDGEQIRAEALAEAESAAEAIRAAAAEAGRAEAAGIVAAAEASRERMQASMQDDVVDLALEVGRKIVGRELDVSRTAATEICAQALARVRRARSVLIRVNPSDLGRIQQFEGRLAAALSDKNAGLRLEGDGTVSRGGCMVESDIGKVDASLEVQLAALEVALRRNDD